MQRRNFLAAGAAALVQGGGASTASSSAVSSPRFMTSVMLWTLKGSFDQKLEAASRAGLQSVELVGEHVQWSDAEIENVKKRVASAGLRLLAFWVPT